MWLSNIIREEAKARYRAVKYTPTMDCVVPGGEKICLIYRRCLYLAQYDGWNLYAQIQKGMAVVWRSGKSGVEEKLSSDL